MAYMVMFFGWHEELVHVGQLEATARHREEGTRKKHGGDIQLEVVDGRTTAQGSFDQVEDTQDGRFQVQV